MNARQWIGLIMILIWGMGMPANKGADYLVVCIALVVIGFAMLIIPAKK